jgi:hypothetical protein
MSSYGDYKEGNCNCSPEMEEYIDQMIRQVDRQASTPTR